jgi:hypothetical protein
VEDRYHQTGADSDPYLRLHCVGARAIVVLESKVTDQPPGALTALNRVWNFTPAVTDTSGCFSLGYEKRERAIKFQRTDGLLAISLRAS